MAVCTVVRTHHLGRPIPQHEWGPGLPGPVNLAAIMHSELRRTIKYLYLDRPLNGDPTYPDLFDPEWQTFGSDRGMVVSGFEEVDGRRYYQSWYVSW